jgi:glycosyltransferase involved in cell wall biosynthesis
VKLLIVGDGPLREKLIMLANDLQVAESVHFTGLIPYEKMPGYLAMCDAFVTASVSEVHPLSVIEAMGAGLPVMGIMSPGVGDTVEDGISGFLSSNNLAAFTAKLTRLCLQTSLRKKMGEQARNASQKYDIERTTGMMMSYYERIVNAPRRIKPDWEKRLRSILERFRL